MVQTTGPGGADVHARALTDRLQPFKDLDLLEPMQAQLKFRTGEELTIGGFQVINRGKVKELDPGQLAEMSKVDELELIYLHLLSMQNVTDLASHVQVTEDDLAYG